MGSFMGRFPRLGHQPDIVLEGFDGRDSYTILEVKTCEPAGDAYIARQHTDTSRGAAHRYLEQTLAPGQYTIPAHQPGAPRLRLLTFAVSACVAPWAPRRRPSSDSSRLGSRALCLTGCLTRRAGPRRGVPLCSARRSPSRPAGRSLPASVGAPAPARRPPTLSAATISPPPTRRAASTARLTRLLLSSDLLRVAAWVAVGLCLGSGFALSLVVYCPPLTTESPTTHYCTVQHHVPIDPRVCAERMPRAVLTRSVTQ